MQGTLLSNAYGEKFPEQFRIARFQVYNWGTFSDLHEIPIAREGFLFVGASGSGKSTLLDGFTALLIPQRFIDFNAAAREADSGARDRSVMSYVRGAWSQQEDPDSGNVAVQYLRKDTTWSALGVTYSNKLGKYVTMVQLFWVRGQSTATQDLRRAYLIFEAEVDLRQLKDFGSSNFDLNKVRLAHPTAFIKTEFSPYCERYCRLLGIHTDAQQALRLLHRTQSAKNLGDLNQFLRTFMLDTPKTFEVAARLIDEFTELNSAHKAVLEARDQKAMLTPPSTNRYVNSF